VNVADFNRLIRCLHDSDDTYARGVAKRPPYDPDSSGVPPEMFDGEVDQEGWVRWKVVPSTVSEADIVSFFKEYEITPPRALVEYMRSDFHLLDQVSTGFFPDIPSDNPFRPMRELLEAPGHKPLIEYGYIPVALMYDDQGVICYKQSDGRVVWFDHELLASIWWPRAPSLAERMINRLKPKIGRPTPSEDLATQVRSLEQPLFDTLDEFYVEALKCRVQDDSTCPSE
jgi:hypothetical protein